MEGGRLIAEAVLFAADAHADDMRDDGRTPYFNHLAEVAARCAAHVPFDAELVAAAYLHDTVEDTGVSEALLRERFGDVVADVVMEVTDPPELKGEARRQHQVERAATASLRAKLIKIADKTSNVTELVDSAAPDEPLAKQRRYLEWAHAVVNACRGSDAALEEAFDTAAGRLATAIAAREGKDKP